MDKKRKKKQYIAWICLVALVALLAAMPLIAGRNAEAEGPAATVKTGRADTGTILTTLCGGGSLAEESAEAITLPEGVKLREYLVSDGQTVQKGDPLASVDKISVMAVIAEVQETMDYLSAQIESAESDEAASQLKAQTAGRVKQIFVQPGDDVQDVMLEHGALAVLSLDGRMAVDIRCDTTLTTCDSVAVVFSGGTEITGRVESSLGGTLTVSVADSGYAVGEQVAVKSPEGEPLGTGELYIHNAWKVTAYFGRVAKVHVQENDKVTAGKLLFRLENTDHSTQVQILNAERQEYEALMEKLFGLYGTGYLCAPCDGIVYGVDRESTWLLSAVERQWRAELLNQADSVEKGWSVMLLSNETPEAPETSQPPAEGGEEPAPARTWHVISAVQVDSQVSENVWNVRRKDVNATVSDLSILSISIPQTTPAEELAIAGVQTQDGQPHTVKTGDILLYVQEEGGAYWLYHSSTQSGNHSAMGSFGNFGSFSFGSAQQQIFEKFDLTETTVLTVTPGETMTLDIAIDELDIGKVFPGQEAVITIHALGEKQVTGIVSRIGGASNSGGNSKFTVTLTLEREENMLAGMSASAAMELYRAETVLRIPVAALNENGRQVFVYTGYDAKEDMLKDPVTVTLGSSDGEYVQILSGLTEGDTFYYAYYDAQESSALS